jgi:Uma2 family endonuclease
VPERPGAGWVETRPDWVCEVLSPTHEKRDLVDKLATLHAAGVPSYWVIDREKRILFSYRHDTRAYLVRTSAGEVIAAEPFEQVMLRTGVIFGDEDDAE